MPTAEQNAKIQDIADRLGVPFEWLYNIIKLESNFNPQAKNKKSSARGLIQVIDDTARGMFHVSGSAELIGKYPDFSSQMDNVVFPYFNYYMPAGGYQNEAQFYITVFYPAYRNKPLDTLLPAEVRKVNPVTTVGDYVALVRGSAPASGINYSPEGTFENPRIPTLILLVGVGIAAYYLYKMSKKYPIALPAY